MAYSTQGGVFLRADREEKTRGRGNGRRSRGFWRGIRLPFFGKTGTINEPTDDETCKGYNKCTDNGKKFKWHNKQADGRRGV